MKHGATTGIDPAIYLGDDPDLALVNADMHAWSEAHPCDCDGLCECTDADA